MNDLKPHVIRRSGVSGRYQPELTDGGRLLPHPEAAGHREAVTLQSAWDVAQPALILSAGRVAAAGRAPGEDPGRRGHRAAGQRGAERLPAAAPRGRGREEPPPPRARASRAAGQLATPRAPQEDVGVCATSDAAALSSDRGACRLATTMVVEVSPPGAEVPMALPRAWPGPARAARHGFGIEWRARDAGGGRRIRELVRRITARRRRRAERGLKQRSCGAQRQVQRVDGAAVASR